MNKKIFFGVGILIFVLAGMIFLPKVVVDNVVLDYCDKDFCVGEGNNDTNVDLFVSSINYSPSIDDLAKKNPGEFFVEPVIGGANSSSEIVNRIYLRNSKGYMTGECEFVYPNKTGCDLSGLINQDYYTVEVRVDVKNAFDEKYRDNNIFKESFYFGLESIAYIEFKEAISKVSFEKDFCSGCYVEGKCLPLGYNDEGIFCSSNGLKKQYMLGQECEFDFECMSLKCSEGRCE
ncbi:MAG: hypothetical protein PF542_04055 [Nanoarchaeota archaeon]|jgi:hypothetical protein|nr:hypothetical protein [Nanoarchaeota archaeon]